MALELYSQKSSIVNVGLGSKYACGFMYVPDLETCRNTVFICICYPCSLYFTKRKSLNAD